MNTMQIKVIRYLLLLMVTCLLYVGVAARLSTQSFEQILMSGVILFLTAAPIVATIALKSLHGLPIFQLNLIFYSVSIGFGIFSTPSEQIYNVGEQSKIYALQLTAIGVVSQIVGFAVGITLFKNRVATISFIGPAGHSIVLKIGILFYSVRIVSILFPSVRDIPSVGQFILLASSIGIALIYSSSNTSTHRSLIRIVLFSIIIPLESVIGISTGSIGNFMVIIMLLVVVGLLNTNRVPWRILVVGILGYLMTAPVKMEFRYLTWGQGLVETTTYEKFQLYMELVVTHWMGDSNNNVNIASDREVAMFERFNHFPIFSLSVDLTPDFVPYWYGETIVNGMYSMIPRILWANKPQLSFGNAFGHRMGILHDQDITTSINLPWIIELYVNFGPYGIAIGMCVIGIAFALFHKLASGTRDKTPDRVLHGVLLVPLCFPESNLALMWGGLAVSFLVTFALCRLLATIDFRGGVAHVI